MSSKKFLKVYYFDDKDLYDFITSSKRRLQIAQLVKLARIRGICVSADDSREDLAHELSLMSFSKRQIDALMDLAEVKERESKTTSIDLQSKSSTDELHAVIEAVKESHGKRDIMQVTKVSSDRIIVKVQYSEIDTSKTRMAQFKPCDVDIEFEKEGTGYRIRHKSSEKASEIVQEVSRKLTGSQQKVLSISSFPTAELRIKFFIQLMTEIAGFTLKDVSVVHCNKMPDVPMHAGSGDDDGDSDDDDPDSALKGALAGQVRKLALHGDGLLTSEEYQTAVKKGLYINRAVWRSAKVDPSGSGQEVEFEAEFAEAETDNEFRYGIRGVYESVNGKTKKTKTNTLPAEKRTLLLLIEEGARTQFNKLAPSPVALRPSVPPVST